MRFTWLKVPTNQLTNILIIRIKIFFFFFLRMKERRETFLEAINNIFRESELLRNTLVIFFTECTRLQLQIPSSDTRLRMGIDWHVGRSLSCFAPVQTEHCLNSLQEPLLCWHIGSLALLQHLHTFQFNVCIGDKKREDKHPLFFFKLPWDL